MTTITSISLGAQQLPHSVTSNLGTLQRSGDTAQAVIGVPAYQNTLGQTTAPEISRGVRPLQEAAQNPIQATQTNIAQPPIVAQGSNLGSGNTATADTGGYGHGSSWQWSDSSVVYGHGGAG